LSGAQRSQEFTTKKPGPQATFMADGTWFAGSVALATGNINMLSLHILKSLPDRLSLLLTRDESLHAAVRRCKGRMALTI
jgi:hypothetical protein